MTTLATPDKLLFEASWAVGVIALEDGDSAAARCCPTTVPPELIQTNAHSVDACPREHFGKAHATRPDNVEALYNLAVANLKLGSCMP